MSIEINCGKRHFALIAIVVVVIIAVMAGYGQWAAAAATDRELRIRELEKISARVDERLKTIEATLMRIERKVTIDTP